MKKLLFPAFICAGLLALIGGCAAQKTVSDNEIGLRSTDLLTEGNMGLKPVDYINTPVGQSKVFDRAFENAPPMIPHTMQDSDTIDRDMNSCLTCHAPEMAAALKTEYPDMKATPQTHLGEIRVMSDGKGNNTFKFIPTKDGSVSQQRYNCTQCHAPQATTAPVMVKNDFAPQLRQGDTKNASNLINKLNEGL